MKFLKHAEIATRAFWVILLIGFLVAQLWRLI